MSNFKKYRRTNNAEMREVTADEIANGLDDKISISEPDQNTGSPRTGDMIARNPKNHDDKWLVAEDYYKNNFELIEEQ